MSHDREYLHGNWPILLLGLLSSTQLLVEHLSAQLWLCPSGTSNFFTPSFLTVTSEICLILCFPLSQWFCIWRWGWREGNIASHAMFLSVFPYSLAHLWLVPNIWDRRCVQFNPGFYSLVEIGFFWFCPPLPDSPWENLPSPHPQSL